MTAVLSIFERIPSQFVAILVGAVTAWLYLRLERNQAVQQALTPILGEFAITYLIVARFAGLFLHPSEVLHFNMWVVLAEAPASGWVFGLVAANLLLYWRLRKTENLNQIVLHGLTNAALLAVSVWLTARLFVDHGVYLERNLIVLLVAAVLFVLSLMNRESWSAHIHRTWIALAVTLLLSSTLVPSLGTFVRLTSIEWTATILLLLGLYMEALSDMKKKQSLSAIHE